MNRLIFIVLPIAFVMSGCTTVPAVPVIKDLETDKVILQAAIGSLSTEPTQESLDAVANEGCQLHGRKARPISYLCRTNPLDYGEICEYLYACLLDTETTE